MIDGEKIFKLHDTHGLPFSYIIDTLKDEKLSFSIEQWMTKAIESAWSYDKIKSFLLNNLPEEEITLDLKTVIVRTYLLIVLEKNE